MPCHDDAEPDDQQPDRLVIVEVSPDATDEEIDAHADEVWSALMRSPGLSDDS